MATKVATIRCKGKTQEFQLEGAISMAQRHQRGWLKKEMRAEGETWVLFFRTTRKSDGKRVENKVRIGLAKDLPNKASAWAEVDRLHLHLNPVNSRGQSNLC
jgi:hypothetical protein